MQDKENDTSILDNILIYIIFTLILPFLLLKDIIGTIAAILVNILVFIGEVVVIYKIGPFIISIISKINWGYILMIMPGLIISLSLHEFAHAWTAKKLGDDTPRKEGRISLNPFKHLDPLGTILILTVGWGWAKPVNCNVNNFKNPEKDFAKVAFAGPAMNFLLAIIFSITLAILYAIAIRLNLAIWNDGFEWTSPNHKLFHILIGINAMWLSLNIILAIFNLLPFPPLDGSKVFSAIVPKKVKKTLLSNQYSTIISIILFVITIILLVTPLSSYIVIPIHNIIAEKIFKSLIHWLTSLFTKIPFIVIFMFLYSVSDIVISYLFNNYVCSKKRIAVNLLQKGMSQKDISEVLQVSEDTIEKYTIDYVPKKGLLSIFSKKYVHKEDL